MNFTPDQLRKLKPKFDKLTYAKKLLFWDKYFWNKKKDFFFGFHWSYFFSEIDTEEEYSKPENSITIYPSNNQENEIFNNWLFNHIQSEPHYNFEIQKEKYFNNIKDNPRPIEFIESEIAPIIRQRDKEKKLMEAKSNIFSWGFYYGYQSVVQNAKRPPNMEAEKFYKIILGYTKGVCDAYYLGFLENQLETVKQSSKSLPFKNDRPGEDISLDMVYEIFNSIDLDKEMLREKILKNPPISRNKDTFNGDVRILLIQVLEQYKAQTSRLSNENKLAHLQERLKPFPKTTKVVTSKFEVEMEQVSNTVIALLNKFYNAEFNLLASNKEKVEPLPKTSEFIKVANTFDYSNANNYFFSARLKEFEQIEIELSSRGFLNQHGKWKAEKAKLIAFIHILILLGYLKPNIRGKQKRATENAYKRFFETRYGITISELWKPSKFKIGSLKDFKASYHFISGIDKI